MRLLSCSLHIMVSHYTWHKFKKNAKIIFSLSKYPICDYNQMPFENMSLHSIDYLKVKWERFAIRKRGGGCTSGLGLSA